MLFDHCVNTKETLLAGGGVLLPRVMGHILGAVQCAIIYFQASFHQKVAENATR